MSERRGEADEFYADLLAGDSARTSGWWSRQALAGMLWSKQYFGYDVEAWLAGHGADPLGAAGAMAQP